MIVKLGMGNASISIRGFFNPDKAKPFVRRIKMKNMSRLFIIVILSVVFPLLAGNVVPSQAALVMDEYGTGFYNDGTGWHDWPSFMVDDPFVGTTLPWFFTPAAEPPLPFPFFDIVAFEYGHFGDTNEISDIVRLIDLNTLTEYETPLLAWVLYSDEINLDIPADVGLPTYKSPFNVYVEEQLNETFSFVFPDGNTLLVYSEGHAAVPEPASMLLLGSGLLGLWGARKKFMK
jgi:hypothetical protein